MLRLFDSFRLPVLVMLVGFLPGCASLTPDNRPPEEIVAERAQGWADALLEGNLQGAYEFTSPSYRQFASVGRYNARIQGAARWTKADVDTVTCEPEVCTVRIWVEYSVPQLGVEARRPRDYRWVLSEGAWWLYVSP
jgi:hypothetical protein